MYVNTLLTINLGCEMIYIIDQRLKAQQIDPEKGSIVLNDLANALFRVKHNDTPLTVDTANHLMEQLVHTSIMKLNKESMSKLNDLILMTFKMQVINSNSPYELYGITLKHLLGIQDLRLSDANQQLILETQSNFERDYKFTEYQYLQIRCQIMRFFQYKHIRVQMFLNDGSQNQDGTFSLKLRSGACFVNKPGEVLITQEGMPPKKIVFNLDLSLTYSKQQSTNPYVVSQLGENIYIQKQPQGQVQEKNKSQSHSIIKMNPEESSQQLNELAFMIKGEQKQDFNAMYMFEQVEQQPESQVILQVSENNLKANILNDLAVQEKQDEDDLLDMFDQAADI